MTSRKQSLGIYESIAKLNRALDIIVIASDLSLPAKGSVAIQVQLTWIASSLAFGFLLAMTFFPFKS